MWIVPESQRILTPNRYHATDPRVRSVELFLFHYTNGKPRPIRPRLTRWNAIKGGASTHFVTPRDPRREPTIQLASLTDRTWHAGKGAKWRGIEGVNVRSIGIDADNLGPLTRYGKRICDSYGDVYEGPAPFVAPDGSLWEPYPEEQIEELCRIVRILADLFPIVRTDADRLLPHSAVKSNKIDIGPAFPWDEIRSAAGVTYDKG